MNDAHDNRLDDDRALEQATAWHKIARVPSSQPGKHHELEGNDLGGLRCPCLGFQHRGRCRHVVAYLENPSAFAINSQEMQFTLTFKDGQRTVATVEGASCRLDSLAPGDCSTRMIETERYLERLLGLRVHIGTAE